MNHQVADSDPKLHSSQGVEAWWIWSFQYGTGPAMAHKRRHFLKESLQGREAPKDESAAWFRLRAMDRRQLRCQNPIFIRPQHAPFEPVKQVVEPPTLKV